MNGDDEEDNSKLAMLAALVVFGGMDPHVRLGGTVTLSDGSIGKH